MRRHTNDLKVLPMPAIQLAMTALAPATILPSPGKHTAVELQSSLISNSPLKQKASSLSPLKPAHRPKPQHASAQDYGALRQPRFRTPEAGSILAIVQHNCRRRLYLPPLLWTAEHVKLLGIRFLAKKVPKRKRSDRPIPPELQLPGDGNDLPKFPVTPRDYAAHAAKSLSGPCIVGARTSAATDILAACNFKSTGTSSPSFYFDRDRFDTRLPAPALFTSESTAPSLAYMNLDMLQPVRRKYLYQNRFRSCFYDSDKGIVRINAPVSQLIQKKPRQLQPENELEDPCIAAVLIALAQEQYWAQKQLPNNINAARSTPDSTGFKVHVLAMPFTAAQQIYLYTACIPVIFLDKFDQPFRASPSATVTIAYYDLHLRRPNLLPRRLFLALRAPPE